MKTTVSFLAEKDIIDLRLTHSGEWLSDIMIEFAKIHVKEALDKASENADTCEQAVMRGHEIIVDKETILTSYPLENIK